MYRFLIVFFAVCLTATVGYTDAFADFDADATEEAAKARSGSEKGLRGIINVSTCWLEIPIQTTRGARQGVAGMDGAGVSGKLFGGIFGLSRGIFHGTGRLITGASDLAGFWAGDYATNAGYGTNYDSMYAFQLNVEPSPMEQQPASQHMVNKAYRGVSNVVVLPRDFFRYTNEQARENKPFAGLSKGVWAGSSILWNSATDIISFPFPNYPDTLGNTLQ
ncbi:MAG: hypothetical protein QF541_07460 [Lentisphaeria bacterium]|jgi:hypothetical protein|nr:hypothetical protein [Lentisphaeria bacterium]